MTGRRSLPNWTKTPLLPQNSKKVYPQGFTGETITNAIAEYEKTLITPNSPFDRYLKGDENAISENAKKRLQAFPEAWLPDLPHRSRHGRPVL